MSRVVLASLSHAARREAVFSAGCPPSKSVSIAIGGRVGSVATGRHSPTRHRRFGRACSVARLGKRLLESLVECPGGHRPPFFSRVPHPMVEPAEEVIVLASSIPVL